MSILQINESEMRTFIFHGLKAWHKPEHTVPYCKELLIIEHVITSEHQQQSPQTIYIAVKKIIDHYLQKLEAQNAEYADMVRLHYIDDLHNKEISTRTDKSIEQVKHRVRRGIDQMAQLAHKEENDKRLNEVNRLRGHLPVATYHTLVGANAVHKQLTEGLLSDNARSWFFVVSGIGGIGKTSLVRDVINSVLETRRYKKIVWLYAKNNHVTSVTNPTETNTAKTLIDILLTQLDPAYPLTASLSEKKAHLAQLLKTSRTLLVIDNFEEHAFLENILAELYIFANPLQIVITSRELPEIRPNITALSLRELDQPAAHTLIRNHAQAVGCKLLTEIDQPLVGEVYAAVGGNPFAIKLIVGLAAQLTLPHILRDLVEARHQDIETMYRTIFEASWNSLTDNAKKLLMIMPLATERGMSAELMQHNSGLDFGQMGIAIRELVNHSLIDINGTTVARTYSIHQLTRAFLGSHVLHWIGDLPSA